ncbi:phospholipase D-like domain-containing protein [Actinotignum urinale]|uniref:Restriction endonuclease type II NgoFVII C-terminal B3-like DNA-binding domain-containing protein n=1 Tax=Actinotignum urinale TaxID=190146 RepID=A0AAW9HMU1_9ACTO|nr:hypothetical protein [Actinotignum urinale]MDY5155196.1 hypothetical protein [Actinotignum urinale]
MFYDQQPPEQQVAYKNMLRVIGSLSNLFSTSDAPYLHYRIHENLFAKYFDVVNNSRADNSADAYKIGGVGIGLKTWVGQNNQKIAEFGRLLPNYEHLDGLDLVKQIAHYRNQRIAVTLNLHNLTGLIYHIVKRTHQKMEIFECPFEPIDIDKIELLKGRGGKNSIYFTDGKHTYFFLKSKHTLFMVFDFLQKIDEIHVNIHSEPFELLESLIESTEQSQKAPEGAVEKNILSHFLEEAAVETEQLCLRLYSQTTTRGKFVPEQSGLNQWNGSRRNTKTNIRTPRNPNELYIPFPKNDRDRIPDFFPSKKDTKAKTPFEDFTLLLPNGVELSARQCQQDGKGIMTNPNKALGKWLLRDVLQLHEGEKVTYRTLEEANIDSVIFTKLGSHRFSIDFCSLGTYERFYNISDGNFDEETEE